MKSIVKLWKTTKTDMKWLSVAAFLYLLTFATFEAMFGIIATIIVIVLLIVDSDVRSLF